jgi:large subunit ribosomal protein L1
MKFKEALEELRKSSEKRKFDQTLDLVVNLKNFDANRETINTFVILPFPAKNKKIAAFLDSIKKSDAVSLIITKDSMDKITPKEMKKYAKEYDFFISSAKLMPQVAAKFGKVLGSIGKMPDPKVGSVLMQEQEALLKETVEKLKKTVKIKSKERSLKIPLAKESMTDEQILENINQTFKVIMNALPKKELNIRNIMLKFTMSKSIKVPGDK